MKTSLCKTCKFFIRIVVGSDQVGMDDCLYYDCTLQSSILKFLTHRQIVDGYPLVSKCNQYANKTTSQVGSTGLGQFIRK